MGEPQKDRGPLEPGELNKFLGNMFFAHRADMSYEDTREKLNKVNFEVERSASVFTTVHHSFWEILKDDLQQASSDMSLATHLLLDIKSRVISLLTPTTMILKNDVEKLLDEEVVMSKARKGNIRLRAFGTGILHILERICIPHREEEIQQLLRESDVLTMYRGIIGMTDKMKIDMKRFAVQVPQRSSFEDEEDIVDKVADYVYHLGGDLPITEAWLRKYFENSSLPRDILCRAFVGLLSPGPEPYPETLMMHIPQFEALKRDYYQLIIAVSVVLTSLVYLPPVMCTAESRESCFSMVMILLKGVRSDGELTRILSSVIDQMRITVARKLREMNNMTLTESHIKAISYQVNLLTDPKQRVRRSVTERVQSYLFESLKSEGAAPVPDSLHFIAKELTELSARLNLVFLTNLDKCSVFYEKIMGDLKFEAKLKHKRAEKSSKHFRPKIMRD